VVPWQTEGNFTFTPDKYPPRIKLPILMNEQDNEKMNTTILNPQTDPVTEGVPFPNQPILKIVYANNTPVEGISCIAMMISKNRHIYPRGYRLKVTGNNKTYTLNRGKL